MCKLTVEYSSEGGRGRSDWVDAGYIKQANAQKAHCHCQSHHVDHWGQSPGHPEWVRYESVADLIERNPDCCFITKPDGYAGQPISLPIAFGEEMELAIRYRRLNDGDAPFAIRHVAVGPCPSHMEESERYLTAAHYEASNDWRWTWRVTNQDAIAPGRT